MGGVAQKEVATALAYDAVRGAGASPHTKHYHVATGGQRYGMHLQDRQLRFERVAQAALELRQHRIEVKRVHRIERFRDGRIALTLVSRLEAYAEIPADRVRKGAYVLGERLKAILGGSCGLVEIKRPASRTPWSISPWMSASVTSVSLARGITASPPP